MHGVFNLLLQVIELKIDCICPYW